MEDGSSASKPKPTIQVPPRASMEFLKGSFSGFSPGPMTLVSSLFPEQAQLSFSQLLAGAMASPLAAKTGNDSVVEEKKEGVSKGVKSKVSGTGLEGNRPKNLVLASPPPHIDPALSSLFLVPPGISPSGLLNSPGFLSPLQSPFGMSHQQALAHVTAQAALSQSLKQMQSETQQPSSTDAALDPSVTCQPANRLPEEQECSNVETPIVSSSDSKVVADKPATDGYNWRKYGQKNVKASECPRSYYKCTYPDCSVKKKVERSIHGRICEITYKGQHTHAPPQSSKRVRDDGTVVSQAKLILSSQDLSEPTRLKGEDASAQEPSDHRRFRVNRNVDDAVEAEEDKPVAKKRNSDMGGPSHQTVMESKIVLQTRSEVDLLDDGYRWRKYGQKVVKGNPYPRSYYRCTYAGCNVRKHIERASSDPKSVITTYEGKHNHDLPVGRSSSHSLAASSQQQSQNMVVNEIENGNKGQKPVTLHFKGDEVIA